MDRPLICNAGVQYKPHFFPVQGGAAESTTVDPCGRGVGTRPEWPEKPGHPPRLRRFRGNQCNGNRPVVWLGGLGQP